MSKSIYKMLSLPFKHSPIASAIGALYFLIAALIPAVRTLTVAWFIDTAISVVRDGNDSSLVILPIVLLTVIVAYNWISPNADKLIFTKMELTLREKLRADVIEKRAKLEYRYIEDAETWDLITRVSTDPETKIKDGYFNILSAFQLVISTISVMGILIAYAWWVGIILIVLTAPIFYLSLKSGKKQYDAEREAAKYDRRYEYLFKVLNDREYADERALFGYSEKQLGSYIGFYDKSRKIRVRMWMKWMIRSKIPSLLIGVAMTAVIFALLTPVVNGAMSPGIYIALVGAISAMSHYFSWQLSSITDTLAKTSEYLKDFYKFFSLDEVEGATSKPSWGVNFKTLEFRNVTFAYPGTERNILNNICFTIENGRHYSFVGANGAGKTTITKLICGLYTNYIGEILIDGKDIRTIPQEMLKALACCVFQDFSKYQISMFDNIALGSIGADNVKSSVENAVTAVKLTDAVNSLPNGLDSMLGKIYDDGTDLSGGQWQRVALARASASPAPLRILDEPTAALDPIAESVVYSQFEEISRGVTTIFISHRLASAKLADVIFVIDEGKIKEQGNHNELISVNGLYAEMFESQRSWYV